MKIIDINNWKGKKHYLWFKEYAHPYYSITSTIDITNLLKYIKDKNLPFFASFMYLIVRSLNEIEEFRLRIVNGQVVLYDLIHPAFTVMTDDGVFDNCDVELDCFDEYLKKIKINMDKTKSRQDLEKSYNDNSRYDQYYITCLPWIDFTSATNPMTDNRFDTVPRIGWGKYYIENDKVLISLSIQVNHMLVDGYPLSKGFLKVQEMVNDPIKYLK